MVIRVIDSASRRPLAGARVTLRFAGATESTVETDENGAACPTIPAEPGPTLFLVERRGYQREQKPATVEELAGGLSVEMIRTNGWYFVQRFLEWPADLLRLLPVVGRSLEALRTLSRPAAWVAHQRRPARIGASGLALIGL